MIKEFENNPEDMNNNPEDMYNNSKQFQEAYSRPQES